MFTDLERDLIRAATDADRKAREARAALAAKPTKANAHRLNAAERKAAWIREKLYASDE